METVKRTTQAELISVLGSHRALQHVTIPMTDCRDFWDDFRHDIGNNDKLSRENLSIYNMAFDFKNVDDLSLVNKKGRILKRFAKFYKESTGRKLTDSELGIIGDIFQYYVDKQAKEYYLDFTNVFDWDDGQFGHRGSCYWGQYSNSLPALQDNGCWAIRFYANESDEQGIGRTWIFPKGDMFLCFNSYGVSRAMTSKCLKEIFKSHGITLHYKAVNIYNSENDEIPYINSTGFVMYPESILSSDIDSEHDLEISGYEQGTPCSDCGGHHDREDMSSYNNDMFCESCFSRLFSSCDKCGEDYPRDDLREIHGHPRYTDVCEYCFDRIGVMECSDCERYIVDDYIITDDSENVICSDCAESSVFHCDICDKNYESQDSCDCDDTHDSVDSDFTLSSDLETVKIQDIEKTLTVYRDARIAGLFVCKVGSYWSVIHEQSGLRPCGQVDTRNQALRLMNLLGDVIDWNQSADGIIAVTDIHSKVQAAYNLVTRSQS